MQSVTPEAVSLYDEDFFEWTQNTAQKIRDRQFHEIDLNAVAEEIEDLGRRDWREVDSRIKLILLHLLKLQYQPQKRMDSDSWVNSISRERSELESIFDFSESLRAKGKEGLSRTYQRAVKDAARETKLPKSTFPAICPFTFEQILDEDFYPDS